MGATDPQIRVATSGTNALGRHYALNAGTAGRVLTSQGDNLPPIWGAGGGVRPIAQTYAVDLVNWSATPDGSLGAPFRTIQDALDHANLLGDTLVQLLIAPGVYPAAVNVPIGMDVAFHGWDPLTTAVIAGDITIAGAVGASAIISFTNCDILGANLRVADPTTQDLSLEFRSSYCAAAIAGFAVDVHFQHAILAGALVANDACLIEWDNYSWGRYAQLAGPLPVGAVQRFLDSGHDTYPITLAALGLAIGATTFLTIVSGTLTKLNDHASVRVNEPAAQDFTCGVHSVNAGQVVVWLTNISRASTNFNDGAELLIHHNTMIVEPAP